MTDCEDRSWIEQVVGTSGVGSPGYLACFQNLTTLNIQITVFWVVTPCRSVKFTNVSKEITACIFRVDEYAK
jgi:hypothetical protein